MFVYSRLFTQRVAQLCESFSVPVHFSDNNSSSPAIREFVDEIDKVPIRLRTSHKNFLFRKNVQDHNVRTRSYLILFHKNMPFVLEQQESKNKGANLSSDIKLARSFYVRTFIEHLALEVCSTPLTNLLHSVSAFFQAVYESRLGICLQRDFTNEEKVYVYNTFGAGEERSNIETFNAYLRTSHLTDP